MPHIKTMFSPNATNEQNIYYAYAIYHMYDHYLQILAAHYSITLGPIGLIHAPLLTSPTPSPPATSCADCSRSPPHPALCRATLPALAPRAAAAAARSARWVEPGGLEVVGRIGAKSEEPGRAGSMLICLPYLMILEGFWCWDGWKCRFRSRRSTL